MAKRFTDTEKYKKPFIRSLQGPYKLLWDYLYHDCDHAGIWIADFEIAQIYLGKDMPVNAEDALKFFNQGEQRVIPFDEGKKWFIRPFVEFQYGELNPNNRVHKSVITALQRENLYHPDKGLASPLQGCKDKDKDKDKDKERRAREILKDQIDSIYQAYPRKVAPKKAKEKIKTALDEITYEELLERVEKYARAVQGTDPKFIPHPATWFHQGRYMDDPKEWGDQSEVGEKEFDPEHARRLRRAHGS